MAKAKSRKNHRQFSKKQEVIGKPIYLAFIVFIAIVPLLGLYGLKYGYSPDLHMGSLLQIGSLLFLAFIFWRGKNGIELPKDPIIVLVVLLYAWMCLSLLWALNDYEGSLKLLDWGAALVGFFLILLFYKKTEWLYKALPILFFSGLVAALLSVLQYWFNVQWVPQAVIPGSFFSNKNMSAQYLLLTMPIAVILLFRYQDRGRQIALGLSIGLMLGVIAYTTARAAWVGAIAQLVLFITWLSYEKLKHKKLWLNRNKSLGLAAGLLLFVMMLGLNSKGFSVDNIFDYGGEVSSVVNEAAKSASGGSVRKAIWLNSLLMIEDYWLTGIGVGNWVIEYPIYHQAVVIDPQMSMEVKHDNAHNDYIEIIAELGLVGFLMLLAIGVLLCRHLKRLLSSNNEHLRLLSIGLFIPLAGIAVDALASFPLQQPVPVYWCFMLTAGIVMLGHMQNKLALNKDSHAQSKSKNSGHQAATVDTMDESGLTWRFSINTKAIAVVAFIAAGGLVILHNYWYQSEIYKRQAIIASQQGKFDLVKTFAEKAYELKPFHAELLHAIGVGLREQGQHQLASEYLEKALLGYPHTITYLTNAADNYIRMKDFAKARQHLQHLIEIRPYNFDLQRLLGLVLINEFKDYEQGLSHLDKALKVEPNHRLAPQLRNRVQLINQQLQQLQKTSSDG